MKKRPKKYKKQIKHPKVDYLSEKTTEPIKVVKGKYENIPLPPFVKELEILIRKQQRLGAIKLLSDHTRLGIQESKKAIDVYCEEGKWNHIEFELKNAEFDLLDLVFKQIYNKNIDSFKNDQVLSEQRKKWFENNIQKGTIKNFLTFGEGFSLAKKYGLAVVERYEDNVWKHIKTNYILIPKK